MSDDDQARFREPRGRALLSLLFGISIVWATHSAGHELLAGILVFYVTLNLPALFSPAAIQVEENVVVHSPVTSLHKIRIPFNEIASIDAEMGQIEEIQNLWNPKWNRHRERLVVVRKDGRRHLFRAGFDQFSTADVAEVLRGYVFEKESEEQSHPANSVTAVISGG